MCLFIDTGRGLIGRQEVVGFQLTLQQVQMTDNFKSTLVLGQNSKKDEEKGSGSTKEIEYKQVANLNDFVGELSDEEKEAEFNKQHEQYVKMKVQRKKEMIRLKKQQFGSSSSDQNNSSSEQQIEQFKGVKKIDSKRSKGKIESKAEEQSQFSVLLQLKKSITESILILFEQDLQINKKVIPFTRINKLALSLSTTSNPPRATHKLRIGIGSDEDIVFTSNNKQEKGNFKVLSLFLRLLRIILGIKNVKLGEEGSRCNLQQFGQLREGALLYDKIYKKSQIIGTWQERYIIIRADGLYSYRTLKSKPTMYIPLKEITEVQTQFQLYKQLLVVKLFYNGTKTDFGVPLDCKLQWLMGFANLLAIQ